MKISTLKSVSLYKNDQLIEALIEKSRMERKVTLEVIELLEELDRRSLHLERGYGSLLEFCMKALKYSESAAYRRISAMRVAKELPQVKKSIEEGSLNLVTVTQAHAFFRQEKKCQNKVYTKAEKLELLSSLKNKSKRETEKILIQKSPSLPQPEVIRHITENMVQVTLNLDEKLIKQLGQIKYAYSHLNPNPSYAELIGFMAKELIERRNKIQEKADEKIKTQTEDQALRRNDLQQNDSLKGKSQTRSISIAIRHFVFKRDGNCCTYVDSITKRKCQSRFQLEIDHVVPFSKGGGNDPDNLRLVCRNHNRYYWEYVQSRSPPEFKTL
jgi:5-methylcytosine-specific restriction endonuclease McrA